MVNDLRLELRCRNNVLWHAIFDVYPSVADFCRRHALDQRMVGEYLNLSENPYTRPPRSNVTAGDEDPLRRTPRRLCEITGLGPDELFPPDLYGGFPTRRVAELSSDRFLSLTAARRLSLPPVQDDSIEKDELRAAIAVALDKLTPRERRIIERRFGLNGNDAETLEDVGHEFKIGRERVRAIEAKALRKLRHPSRSKHLRPFVGITDTASIEDQAKREPAAVKVESPPIVDPATVIYPDPRGRILVARMDGSLETGFQRGALRPANEIPVLECFVRAIGRASIEVEGDCAYANVKILLEPISRLYPALRVAFDYPQDPALIESARVMALSFSEITNRDPKIPPVSIGKGGLIETF
jgi:RNA polymerase sigma factor (sigma-70 family)